MNVFKVFISSTYEDLIPYRQAAIEVVNRYDECKPLAMEFFMAKSQEPKTVCEKEIKKCDIFVGIYAHRYGFIPRDEAESITQQEYELAKKEKKDCLCFIIKKDFPWNPEFIEKEKYSELVAFLNMVKEEKVVSSFESKADFSDKFSSSLSKLISRINPSVGEPGTCIPLALEPFIAHPYPLPDHFTGRVTEMDMLSKWIYNDKEPLLVMEAIGGMGKSALSWVWLQQDILGRSVELDGIFWWSFYDTPFEYFLHQLTSYIVGQKDDDGSMLPSDLTKLQAALHNGRFLLVLDGFERELRGYSGMSAMYAQERKFHGSVVIESAWDKHQRETIHPRAARFLKHLTSVKSKTLIITRLMPTSLDGLSGVKHVLLEGLSPKDAVRFFRDEGITGRRRELEQAGKVYDYHPLMLKLLTSAIKRSRTKSIKGAFNHNLINQQEPQKILGRAFNLLSKNEHHVATRISVFRGVFNFDAAIALLPNLEKEQLWEIMLELQSLGFLFYSEKEDSYTIHPIMCSFLYHKLEDKIETHNLAVRYYDTLPKVEKIISLEDLNPMIELYHHMIKAENFDVALELLYERIYNPTYYQFSAYYLIIELMRELFPGGEDQLPNLEKEEDQAWTLNALANAYSLTGQCSKAASLYLQQIILQEENEEKGNLAIGLAALASVCQLPNARFSTSVVHLRKSIALCREIENDSQEAIGHQELAFVLINQGNTINKKEFKPSGYDMNTAEDELNRAIDIFKKYDTHYRSVLPSYFAFSAVLQTRLARVLIGKVEYATEQSLEALTQVRKALELAIETVDKEYPHPRDFIRGYWLLGESLIQYWFSTGIVQIESFEVRFYDEYFQNVVESLLLKTGNQLVVAERCLNEALLRCRRVNLVEFEPGVLLALVRLEWAKLTGCKDTDISKYLESIQERIKEAYEIARRSGYNLKLADIHLFCAEVLLKVKESKTLLGFTAKEHLQKTKEYALDVSEFSDLYKSEDPHFYNDIPEYEMLKRGMTEEERIQNGYWVAYKIAEALEEIL
ncbi:MAG: DUF4062 domain-containing protein [bacterium]|nr:DUF4062 domain-containing protein [bacterium]